jgi:hypothetical protein
MHSIKPAPRKRGGNAASMLKLLKMANMAQEGFQGAQSISGLLKPLLNQYGGEYGQQATNFLQSIGLGQGGVGPNYGMLTNVAGQYARRGTRGRGGASGGRLNGARLFNNLKILAGRGGASGGYSMKGKSPLSSSATSSKSLDIANLLRTAQAAASVYDQSKQAISSVKPFLPTSVSDYLGSWGFGKKGKKNDGRSQRAAIVRQVMQTQGVSLPMASKIVKEQGLYKSGRRGGILGSRGTEGYVNRTAPIEYYRPPPNFSNNPPLDSYDPEYD